MNSLNIVLIWKEMTFDKQGNPKVCLLSKPYLTRVQAEKALSFLLRVNKVGTIVEFVDE